MDVLDEQVGREDKGLVAVERQDGAVVADALEPVGGECGEERADVFDEAEFGHGCPGICGRCGQRYEENPRAAQW